MDNQNRKNLNNLPPETKEFINQNIHKVEKYMNNPLFAGFLGAAGIDLSELKKLTNDAGDGLISIKTTKKTPGAVSESNVIYTNNLKTDVFQNTESPAAQQNSAAASEPLFPRTAAPRPATPAPPIPSTLTPSTFTNKPDIRGALGIVAVIGLIGWLLYQFTDII